MARAFTRAVSQQLERCELTHLARVPIDIAKAAIQHAAYETALAEAGFTIVRMPELPDAPDAVFVEDTAILLADHAVITRPSVPSRAAETPSTAAALANEFDLHHIDHGHVDGGDVLRIGNRLYVGRSSRTDKRGIEALRTIVQRLGFEVVAVELRDCLHLKTGTTFAGMDAGGNPVLLYEKSSIDPRQFEGVDPLPTEAREEGAANCLRARRQIILPSGCPRTADKLRSRGFTVVEVDVSELQKAEAGVTCMSLLDERASG